MDKKENLEKVMKELTNLSPSEEDMEKIANLKEAYEDKSEEDIFFEIIEINQNMKETMSREEYERVFQQLESLRPMLSGEQLEKLDKLLSVLGR